MEIAIRKTKEINPIFFLSIRNDDIYRFCFFSHEWANLLSMKKDECLNKMQEFGAIDDDGDECFFRSRESIENFIFEIVEPRLLMSIISEVL